MRRDWHFVWISRWPPFNLEDCVVSRLALEPDEILIASTLGLQTSFAAGEKPRARLVICGVTDDGDVDDARAPGARRD